MAKARQAGQSRRAGRWLALAAAGTLSLAAGCSHTPHAQAPPLPPDPLLVPPQVQPIPGAQPTTAAQPQAFQPNGVPALPASLTATNTATLAGASWQGPNARPLKIDDNNSTGPSFLPGAFNPGTSTQQVPGYLPPNANPKVEAIPDVNKPADPPVTPTGSWQTPNAAPVTQPATVALSAAELLAKQLKDRGVIDQKQDVGPDGVRLTCYVLQGPGGGYRILEVTAVDYAAAAQAILQQLDVPR
ncbi:MAG: hypothetical protein HY289_12635 [Planctomycetes bacterium]|nr:hypothetical protein [Planctomycetota bacterium]